VIRRIPKLKLDSVKRLKPTIIPRPKIRQLPVQALRSVTSKDGMGIYASSDTLFKGAVFGRDSLEVGEDLLQIKPRLVDRILLTLASLQGEELNEEREEEPGKIIHEYRTSIIAGKPIDEIQQQILEKLAARWGGTNNELAYYGSIDSTPLFIRLMGRFCKEVNPRMLRREVHLRSGYRLPMSLVVDNAVDWLLTKLKDSKSGFLEYHRMNPHGIENQAWKDSKEFYVHEDGSHVNHSRPVSSIEVQAVAYDALLAAAELLPQRADDLKAQAEELQNKIIEHLWQPHRHYFGLGTDFGKDGKLRIITTKTANPAEMLDSRLFDNLAKEQQINLITGLVRTIMSHSFLTDCGIRSRALEEAELVSFWDYHGSYTSWPKESYDIAKGLRRQGFSQLAHELENRLLNVVRAIRAYPEFIYVDGRGRVLGMPPSRQSHGELMLVDSRNRPEKTQAWTLSAFIAINSYRRPLKIQKIDQLAWQRDLEREILRTIPSMPRFRSDKELAARYPAYPYELTRKN